MTCIYILQWKDGKVDTDSIYRGYNKYLLTNLLERGWGTPLPTPNDGTNRSQISLNIGRLVV